MANNFIVGMPRRNGLDSFSDAARFPSMYADTQAKYNALQADQTQAMQQHALALAGGANSNEARFDPLGSGNTLFARQNPGFYDSFLQQGMPRRADAPPAPPGPNAIYGYAADTGYAGAASQSPDAMTRYAAEMGYGQGPTGYAPMMFNSATNSFGPPSTAAASANGLLTLNPPATRKVQSYGSP